MADDKKPDPVDDLKKGLGLLFRAAKSAAEGLHADKLEDAVKTGAREVGRAIENVADTIDKQLFKKGAPPDANAPPPPHVDAPSHEAQPVRVDTTGTVPSATAAPPAGPDATTPAAPREPIITPPPKDDK